MKSCSHRSRASARRLRAMLALGLCLVTSGSFAAGSCSVSSTGVAFGPYQPVTFAGKLTSVDKPSTATITVSCTGLLSSAAYSIGLGPSSYGSGDRISSRAMNNSTNGGAAMVYNIFTEATYSTVWGNGAIGTSIGGNAPLIAGSSTQSHTVYGKVAAGQTNLKAGSFSDSLTMTITYNP